MKRGQPLRRTALQARTEIKRSDKPLQRTPIPSVSKRRAREQRVYTKLRAVFLRLDDGGRRCEFPGGCVNAADEVHHKRGRVGELYLDVTHWLPVCESHHRWITGHPAAAVAMGVSELRVSAA